MTYQIKIVSGAKKDLKKLKNTKLEKSFLEVIETLRADPFSSTQSFEKLVPPIKGYYSRRLDIQNYIVYKVDKKQQVVTIYSAWSHYEF